MPNETKMLNYLNLFFLIITTKTNGCDAFLRFIGVTHSTGLFNQVLLYFGGSTRLWCTRSKVLLGFANVARMSGSLLSDQRSLKTVQS